MLRIPGKQAGLHKTGRSAWALRRARIDLERCAWCEFRGYLPSIRDRYDLVVGAVDDQRRRLDLLHVDGTIGFRKRLDPVVVASPLRPTCMPHTRPYLARPATRWRRAVTTDVAVHRAAPGRMADQHRVPEIKCLDQRRERRHRYR